MNSLSARRLGAALLSFGLLVCAPPAGAETVTLAHGIILDLPDGWRVDGPDQGRLGRDGLRRVQLVCETETCRTSQETCTILMRDTLAEGTNDAAQLQGLYQSPFQRYLRLRAVLRATSRDAEILSPLELVRLGQRDWYGIETDARHNYKSGLFAETVVNGRYVGAICKTCETGALRHQDGRRILASLKSVMAKPTAWLARQEGSAARL